MPARLSRLLVDKAYAASQPTPPAELQLAMGEDNNLSRAHRKLPEPDALGFLSSCGPFIVHAAIGLALEQRRAGLPRYQAPAA